MITQQSANTNLVTKKDSKQAVFGKRCETIEGNVNGRQTVCLAEGNFRTSSGQNEFKKKYPIVQKWTGQEVYDWNQAEGW